MNIIKRKAWTTLAVTVILIAALLIGVAEPVSAAPRGGDTYVIEISGVDVSDFSLVTIPKSVVQIIEFQDGDDPILRKRPGRISCTNMVIATDLPNPELDAVWDWYENVRQGQYDRRAVSIIVFNRQGENIARYNALGAWPFEWRLVNQEGKRNRNSAIVEIEFVIEELYMAPSNLLQP